MCYVPLFKCLDLETRWFCQLSIYYNQEPFISIQNTQQSKELQLQIFCVEMHQNGCLLKSKIEREGKFHTKKSKCQTCNDKTCVITDSSFLFDSIKLLFLSPGTCSACSTYTALCLKCSNWKTDLIYISGLNKSGSELGQAACYILHTGVINMYIKHNCEWFADYWNQAFTVLFPFTNKYKYLCMCVFDLRN